MTGIISGYAESGYNIGNEEGKECLPWQFKNFFQVSGRGIWMDRETICKGGEPEQGRGEI